MGMKANSKRWPSGVRGGRSGRQLHKRTALERQRLLEMYARSGLSQRRFCESHAVALSTLTYWLRRARRGGSDKPVSAVVEVPLGVRAEISGAVAASGAEGVVSIRLPNGLEVRADAGADVRWVSSLLRELQACSA